MSAENKNNTHKWAVGEKCWYEENWSGIPQQAAITAIKDHETGAFQYAELKGIGDSFGSTSRPLSQLFLSRQEVLDAMAAASQTKVQEYEASIQTVEDLVRFGYDHHVARAEEYSDDDARTAYRNRAKALLGIDLEA